MSLVLFWGFIFAASIIIGQGVRVQTLKKELKRANPAALTTAKPKDSHRLELVYISTSTSGKRLWFSMCSCGTKTTGAPTEAGVVELWKKHRDLHRQLELESDDVYAKLRKDLEEKQKELDMVRDNCICKDLT